MLDAGVLAPIRADANPPALPPTKTIFRDLEMACGVVLAVSGGPDSTALMHLGAAWSRGGHHPPVTVASVDHGLRPESRAQADAVIAAAHALGLPAQRLDWDGPKPTRAVQERARNARYTLLRDFARSIGADHLVTAHTLDDQAETLLFRMARGSGLTGLCGMQARVACDGLIHVRPFLGTSKATLIAACHAGGWRFIDDPSNRDTVYARGRWRRLTPLLAAEGLTADRLGHLAERLARAETALQTMTQTATTQAALESRTGTRCFAFASLATQPIEIVQRVIGTALVGFSGDGLRLERLETLTQDLLAHHHASRPLVRTLHHCRVVLDASATLTIAPETRVRRRGLR